MLRECDARSNLELTSQRGECPAEIKEQETAVIRDDQTKQACLVEVADCPGECHDRSDVTPDWARRGRYKTRPSVGLPSEAITPEGRRKNNWTKVSADTSL